jgi:hypothetical protein
MTEIYNFRITASSKIEQLRKRIEALNILYENELHSEFILVTNDVYSLLTNVIETLKIDDKEYKDELSPIAENLNSLIENNSKSFNNSTSQQIISKINQFYILAHKRFKFLKNNIWVSKTEKKLLKIRFIFLNIIIPITLLASISLFASQKYTSSKNKNLFIQERKSKKLFLLKDFSDNLVNYFINNGTFPATDRWVNANSCDLPAIKNLIPELKININEQNIISKNCSGEISYFSDGRNYKIIISKSSDYSVVKSIFPEVLDPKRPGISYGFWSEGGKHF